VGNIPLYTLGVAWGGMHEETRKTGESLLKFIKQKLEKRNYNILLLNDWHLGSHAVNEPLMNRIFEFIDTNRDSTRILLNGDLFHNITKHSKGDLTDQKLTPQQQLDYAVELFKPYADLIDGVTTGNHDYRTEQEAGIDIMLEFCHRIGITDNYLKYRGIVGYSINKNFYSIELFHGTGGGGTIGGVERNLVKTKRSNADVYTTGHYHKEFAKVIKEYHIDPFNGVVKEYRKWYVCGNTLVDTENYAKKFAYDESFPSQAVIKLSGVRKNRNIEIEWLR
jgi:hypothetical protein